MDLTALAWPFVVLVGLVVVASLIRRGRVQSLGLSKDGGLSLALAPIDARADRRDEYSYERDRKIKEIDDQLHSDIKARTRAMRRPLMRAVNDRLCSAAKNATGLSLRDPLDQAVDDNNLKDKLSSAKRATYFAEKLEILHEEYEDLLESAEHDPCAGAEALIAYLPWEEVAPKLLALIETWGASVAVIIITACEEKIKVYETSRKRFLDNKIAYQVKVCDECIAKNKGYIDALKVEVK
jgi:hypothetical protein